VFATEELICNSTVAFVRNYWQKNQTQGMSLGNGFPMPKKINFPWKYGFPEIGNKRLAH